MKQQPILIFFILLLIILSIIYAFQSNNNKQSKFSQLVSHLTSPIVNGQTAFYFKIKSFNDGVPIIKIALGNQNSNKLLAIYDTGSSFLNISSTDCTSCDLSQGAYEIPADIKKEKFRHTTTIEYGSQIDNVISMTDVLQLPLSSNEEEQRSLDVPFNVTIDRKQGTTGNSNNNVFGGGQEYGSLNSYILPASFSIVCDLRTDREMYIAGYSEQKVRKVKDACGKRFAQVPLFKTIQLPYYVLEVDTVDSGSFSTDTIDYIIVDTGSNYTSLPPLLYEDVQKAINQSLNPSVNIHFFNKESLTLSRNNLFWKHTYELMLDDDTTALPQDYHENTIILGCYALSERVILFSKNTFQFSC
tara:strand:- start:3024 stop:4097 length:1074 start_codon:yes stop_codon:yes gene_type:complete